MVRRKLSFLVTLSMLFLSHSAVAKQSDLAYKGVTANLFKKGKERNSPILGQTALQTSLVENIRFNGPYTPYYNEQGERVYTRDTSDDPLWNLTNIFFPSNNGVLGDVFQSTTNFASYVKDPKIVALLLNYANEVRESFLLKQSSSSDGNKENRENKKQKVTDPLEPREIANELYWALQKKEKDSLDPGKIKSKILVPLLTNIKDAITAEYKGLSIFPNGTTEQLISAFSSYHFNTQQDIWDEFSSMDNRIIHHEEELPNPHSLWTKEDIEKIRLKEANEPFDMNDVFALSVESMFSSPIPYKEGVSLLNNGEAKMYNRTSNNFIGGSIPDCVETAIRHILNLASYDPELKAFNTKSLTPRTNASTDPTVQLIAFLQNQNVTQVNQGDGLYRSAFNTIVADLKDAPEIRYKKDTHNEIFSGFVNIIQVLSRITNISLETMPKERKDKEQWLRTSFEKILNQLNPSRKFTAQITNVDGIDDIFGTITIRATDQNNKKLFSFDVFSKVGHTEARNLKNLTPQELKNTLANHSTTLTANTTEESLWLLFPDLREEHTTHPLYKLFATPLTDNTGRIQFLKTLRDTSENFVKSHHKKLNQILANVLDGISWEDPEILKQVRFPLQGLAQEGFYREILEERVRGFLPAPDDRMDDITEQLNTWKGIDYILIKGNEVEVVDFSTLKTPLEALSKIDIQNSAVKLITGFKNFPALSELSLRGLKSLERVEFETLMQALSNLTISETNIQEIKGLHNIPHLESLRLLNATSLSSLEFEGPMKSLKTLSFDGGSKLQIKGLHHASQLEELQLTRMLLPSLEFKEPMLSLKKLNLESSHLSQLVGLKHVPNLENLNLSSAQLPVLEFEVEMKSLQEINLTSSSIKQIKGFHLAPNLRKLVLESTAQFSSLELDGKFNALEDVLLASSNIKELKGLKNAPNLKDLYVISTKKLSTLEFEAPMNSLRRIYANESALQSIKGLKYLTALEELNLTETSNFSSLEFEDSIPSMKMMKAQKSSIQSIKGLHHLPNLQTLDLYSTKNLSALEFTGPMNQLKDLCASQSNIRTLKGLKNTPNLENLELDGTVKLSAVELEVPMPLLKKITAQKSAIKKITGLGHASNLETLNVDHTKNLSSLEFEGPMEHLKKIKASYSGITEVKGLENVPNLEDLSLYSTSNLSSLTFKKPMNSLKKVNAEDSGIQSIEGLENTPNLEELSVRGARQLTSLEFKKPMTSLKILNAQSSAIKHIKGLNNVSHLEQLSLDQTPLSALEFDKPMDNLIDLYIGYSTIAEIKGLSNLPKLRFLLVSGSKLKSLEFDTQMDSLQRLIARDLKNIQHIRGLNNLPNLKELDLFNNNAVTIHWKNKSDHTHFEKQFEEKTQK